jgi:hypothetical protein
MSTLEDRAWDARQDRIADDQAEREAAELRADRNGFEVGDRVKVSRHRYARTYAIEAFDDERGLVHLEPWDGNNARTVELGRLRAVRS